MFSTSLLKVPDKSTFDLEEDRRDVGQTNYTTAGKAGNQVQLTGCFLKTSFTSTSHIGNTPNSGPFGLSELEIPFPGLK